MAEREPSPHTTAGGQNVGVIDYDTGAITWVTDLRWESLNGVADGPVWAPDSRRLAYSKAGFDGVTEIHVVVPGGEPEVVLEHTSEVKGGIGVWVTDWLPDGSGLVVSRFNDHGSNTLGLVILSDGSFRELRTRPWKEGRPLARVAPDGETLLISEADGQNHDLFLLAIDEASATRLTDHPAAEQEGIWSRDGRHVLFISNRAGRNGLWAIAVEDGEPAGSPFLLQANWGRGGFLGWAGEELVYPHVLNLHDVYTVGVDPESGTSTDSAKLVPYPNTGNNLHPAWSENGREIAFLASSFAGRGRARVVVQPIAGGTAREYALPEEAVYPMVSLRWLSDRNGLSLQADDPQGQPILLRLLLPEGDWEILPLPENMRRHSFEWAGDGRSFFYTEPGGTSNEDLEGQMPESRLHERVLATGEDRVVATFEQRAPRNLVLSPDGRTLAFSVGGGQITLISLETGARQPLDTNLRGFWPSWSPDGSYLSFACREQGAQSSSLCIADLASGTVRQLDLDANKIFAAAVGTVAKQASFYGTFWSSTEDRIAFVIQVIQDRTMAVRDPLEARTGQDRDH